MRKGLEPVPGPGSRRAVSYAAALERGDFQSEVAKVAEARARDIARRKTPLTGVSDFPDLAEGKVETLAVARPAFCLCRAKSGSPRR